MRIGPIEIRWHKRCVITSTLPTSLDLLKQKLDDAANQAGNEGEVFVLTPFEAGILFANQPLPWAGIVHIWTSDLGKLELLLPNDLTEPVELYENRAC